MSEKKIKQNQAELSRRSLLRGAGLAAAGIVGSSVAPASLAATTAKAKAAQSETQTSVTTELPYDSVAAPAVTEYTTDILVVGGGFAGIPAAIEAKAAGSAVLLVDKGHPGYSGCSPFPQCYQYFCEEWGDSREAQLSLTQQASEYLANLDWYKVYLDESKECFDQVVEWGIFKRFPKASVAGDYYAKGKDWEYHHDFIQYDRRARWGQLLDEKKIPVVDHTMITEVVKNSRGRVIGAMGLHVPSGTVITFHARAVLLCNGGGSYKSAGYPTSGVTFDNEWIGYNAGAAIAGKEFTYLMYTNAVAPASSWRNYNWGYLENLHATGGQYGPAEVDEMIKSKNNGSIGNYFVTLREGLAPIDAGTMRVGAPPDNAIRSTGKDDPRKIGNDSDPIPVRSVGGASLGKGIHKCEGIFCGIDDLVGYTGIPGLYAAGDAMASMIYGALYTPGQGGSIGVSHIQGRRAAKAAVQYIASVPAEKIDSAAIDERRNQLLAPLNRKIGFSPYWAEDALVAIMSPWWVDFYKTDASLTGARASLLELKQNILPKLMARNSHELRLCHEMKSKMLSAEIKLRQSLERKESRGNCQRKDYPFRDDKNFLCYITARKSGNGEMLIERVPIKDEWKGDTTRPYAERYKVRYPGEARAMGLKVEGE